MTKIEYKKLNYIFSLNNCIEDRIKELSLSDETKLFVDKIKDYFRKEIDCKIKLRNISLEEKKKLLESFSKSIPSQLLILRNHIKNCLYVTNKNDLMYKYKNIEEDFKRLSIVR